MTLSQAVAKLTSEFGSNSEAYINAVVERQINSGFWKGTTTAMDVAIFDWDDNGQTRRQFTLPREALTAEGVRFDLESGGRSGGRIVHNGWWKWRVNYDCSRGDWNTGIIDMGEFATFRDIPVNAQLRIRTDYVESGTLYIRGTDSTGKPIYSGTVPNVITGTSLNLATNPATTSETFLAGSQIQVVKPVTEGPVRLYSWDGTTETLIATYAPGETNPVYRRYEVPMNSTFDTATVKVKLRFVELIAANDQIYPDSFTALYFGMKAWSYLVLHEPDRAQPYWDLMFQELNAGLRQYTGAQLPKITISGMNSMSFRQIQ